MAELARDAESFVNLDAVTLPSGQAWLQVQSRTIRGWVAASDLACSHAPEDAATIIGPLADRVLKALATRDMRALAGFAHPVKGVRFALTASVDRRSGVVLQAAQIAGALSDPARRIWGFDDGSGAPIRRSFTQYFEAYGYGRNYARAPLRRYNAFAEEDAIRNTVRRLYPTAITVEYRFPDSQPGDGKWTSLVLVFEQQMGRWWLSALIHDGWTI